LLFGFHGRQEAGPALRCVRLSTGRVLWSEERFGAGSIIRARDRLWILREDGELILADASEDGHRRLGSSRILRGTARAYPALGRGRLFARDETELVAIDLRR
ncbi:MAG TPA: alcohol dehydrogenase, partial [Planctomycetota bacterium]|nr:alcohol dehydrogenase [Planctomycetota bacterium]